MTSLVTEIRTFSAQMNPLVLVVSLILFVNITRRGSVNDFFLRMS